MAKLCVSTTAWGQRSKRQPSADEFAASSGPACRYRSRITATLGPSGCPALPVPAYSLPLARDPALQHQQASLSDSASQPRKPGPGSELNASMAVARCADWSRQVHRAVLPRDLGLLLRRCGCWLLRRSRLPGPGSSCSSNPFPVILVETLRTEGLALLGWMPGYRSVELPPEP